MTTTSMEPLPLVLHTRCERGVHTVVLNRASTFNALSADMLTALQTAIDVVSQDATARILVIAAQGKAFCAGHNLKDMRAHPDLVGGPGREVTRLLKGMPGLVAKDGAEGCFAAGRPDGSGLRDRMTRSS